MNIENTFPSLISSFSNTKKITRRCGSLWLATGNVSVRPRPLSSTMECYIPTALILYKKGLIMDSTVKRKQSHIASWTLYLGCMVKPSLNKVLCLHCVLTRLTRHVAQYIILLDNILDHNMNCFWHQNQWLRRLTAELEFVGSTPGDSIFLILFN